MASDGRSTVAHSAAKANVRMQTGCLNRTVNPGHLFACRNSMGKSKHIILGGGMVAGYLAKEFVDHGLKAGELTIVSADTALPYERPPLSKSYLAGSDTDDTILINKEDFYKEHGIEVRLHTEAAGVDADRKVLRLKSGEDLGFENLVIATGAAPRTLDLPGSAD